MFKIQKDEEVINRILQYLLNEQAISENTKITSVEAESNDPPTNYGPVIEILATDDGWGKGYDFNVYENTIFGLTPDMLRNRDMRKEGSSLPALKADHGFYYHCKLTDDGKSLKKVKVDYVKNLQVVIACSGHKIPQDNIENKLIYSTTKEFVEKLFQSVSS